MMENHSVLDESCGHVLLLVMTGEQMGFFLWASLASSLTKLSLTFTLSPLYSCVCFTGAQQRCLEIRVTELVFLPRRMELCLHVLNKLWKLLSFVSLYKHEPFLSQKRRKKPLEMLFLCLPLARSCDLGRFCDSRGFVTNSSRRKKI